MTTRNKNRNRNKISNEEEGVILNDEQQFLSLTKKYHRPKSKSQGNSTKQDNDRGSEGAQNGGIGGIGGNGNGGGQRYGNGKEVKSTLESSRRMMKESLLRTAMINEQLEDEESTMLENLEFEKEIGFSQKKSKDLIKELRKQQVREEHLFRGAIIFYVIVLLFIFVRRFYFPGIEVFTLIGWLTTLFTKQEQETLIKEEL